MKCKGCNNDRRLIKAHIIPCSFYMDLRATADHLNIVPSKSSERISRSNTGDYDTGILCHECDQILGVFDNYGKQVLLDETHYFEEISRSGVIAGWTIVDCDSIRLERFFLSVLWRASISTRSFFRKVSLGPYETILRDYLWSNEVEHASFGCVIAKFQASQKVSNVEKTIIDPHRFKYQGINYYRLYLGGYMIWIRVDQRKPTDSIQNCELSIGRQPLIISKPFDHSNEFKLIHRGVLEHD